MQPHIQLVQHAPSLIAELIAATAELTACYEAGGPKRKWASHQKILIVEPQEKADLAATRFMELLISFLPTHWGAKPDVYLTSSPS